MQNKNIAVHITAQSLQPSAQRYKFVDERISASSFFIINILIKCRVVLWTRLYILN